MYFFLCLLSPVFAAQESVVGYDDGIDHIRTERAGGSTTHVSFVGGRVVFPAIGKDKTYGLYGALGLVSMNLDGSDRKLILPDNNGEHSTHDERALGDWLYFSYNFNSVARIKNDGSSFEILYTAPGGSLGGSLYGLGTKENRYYFKIRSSSSSGCSYLTPDNPVPVENAELRRLGTFSTKHQCYYNFVLDSRLIQVNDINGNFVKEIKIPSGQLAGNPREANVIGFIGDSMILSFMDYVADNGGIGRIEGRIAVIDLNSGTCSVMSGLYPGDSVVSGDTIFYYLSDGSDRSGLNQMDRNGNSRLVVPSQTPARICAAYGGYIYYVETSAPYEMRVYKVQ